MKRSNIYPVFTLTLFLWSSSFVIAQVQKKVVVEHFTNTVCSVCASRNPGFYANLNNQSADVLHIAIHPSAPYSACKLNQHNKVENDARANYYGVYGSTPRFVIQGNVVPSNANINAQSLFDPYLQQTSPLAVNVKISEHSASELLVTISIKTIASHTLGSLLLTSSIVEETLNYTAPNGEQQQHDVFRKSFFNVNGQLFNAPQNIGDSVVFTASVAKNSEWTLTQLYALVVIQEATDKKVVQAERSSLLAVTTGIAEQPLTVGRIYPNPVNNELSIELKQPQQTTVSIYDLTGRIVLIKYIGSNSILDLSALPNGLYSIVLSNDVGFSSYKIVKNTE